MANCVSENTIRVNNATSTCVCYMAFEGSRCDTLREYWEPLQWIRAIILTVVALYLIFWAAIRLAYLRKAKRFSRTRLTDVVGILMLISHIVALPGFWSLSYDMKRNDAPAALYGIINVILRILPAAIRMAATLLIVGFWFDVLSGKLRKKMAQRTRLFCILMASLNFISVIGLAVYFILQSAEMGLTISFFPLLINFLSAIGVFSVIAHWGHNKEKRSSQNQHKLNYVIINLSLTLACWLGYIICSMGTVFLSGTSVSSYLTYAFFLIVFECLKCVFIMRLVDRDGGVIKLTRFMCCHKGDQVTVDSDTKDSTRRTSSASTVESSMPTSAQDSNKTKSSEMVPSTSSADSSHNFSSSATVSE